MKRGFEIFWRTFRPQNVELLKIFSKTFYHSNVDFKEYIFKDLRIFLEYFWRTSRPTKMQILKTRCEGPSVHQIQILRILFSKTKSPPNDYF